MGHDRRDEPRGIDRVAVLTRRGESQDGLTRRHHELTSMATRVNPGALKQAHPGEVSVTVGPKILKDRCVKKSIHVPE